MKGTQDTTEPRTLSSPEGVISGRRLVPSAVVLFHGELSRIGAVTAPDLLGAGRRVLIGRHEPLFLDPSGAAGAFGEGRPLEDPCVSRRQVSIRWLPSLGAFEVEPSPSSRRPVLLVERRAERWIQREFDGEVLLKSGGLIALDDRVLLWLTLLPETLFESNRAGMLGLTPAIERLREDIRDTALFERPVLVTGPTGSGKELTALALHKESAVRSGPFVSVNCAAIPEHLVESALFGYRKGAFTGAEAASKGFFMAADGGTIFLDEFGELPLSIQSKLLRVLQDGRFTPLGADRDVGASVRVIAATNRDMAEEVKAGQLREDLYHRISAHVLRVPTLAERIEDIPALFVHFLRECSKDHPRLDRLWAPVDAQVPFVPMSFFLELMGNDWFGNARELQNIAEQTARLNLRSGIFRQPDLPRMASALPARGGAELASSASEQVRGLDEDERLRAACSALGTSVDTIVQLFDEPDLRALLLEPGEEPLVALVERIRVRGRVRLAEFMGRYGHRQRQTASALGVSRTTLLKLMDCVALPRPKDIEAGAIQEAVGRVGADIDVLAHALFVSPRGLRQRIVALVEKGELDARLLT